MGKQTEELGLLGIFKVGGHTITVVLIIFSCIFNVVMAHRIHRCGKKQPVSVAVDTKVGDGRGSEGDVGSLSGEIKSELKRSRKLQVRVYLGTRSTLFT